MNQHNRGTPAGSITEQQQQRQQQQQVLRQLYALQVTSNVACRMRHSPQMVGTLLRRSVFRQRLPAHASQCLIASQSPKLLAGVAQATVTAPAGKAAAAVEAGMVEQVVQHRQQQMQRHGWHCLLDASALGQVCQVRMHQRLRPLRTSLTQHPWQTAASQRRACCHLTTLWPS
jgi:hypothetical protein